MNLIPLTCVFLVPVRVARNFFAIIFMVKNAVQNGPQQPLIFLAIWCDITEGTRWASRYTKHRMNPSLHQILSGELHKKQACMMPYTYGKNVASCAVDWDGRALPAEILLQVLQELSLFPLFAIYSYGDHLPGFFSDVRWCHIKLYSKQKSKSRRWLTSAFDCILCMKITAKNTTVSSLPCIES